MKMSEEYIIGIDLGTTYSCLAYIDEDGSPVVEKNFEQEETTPSVILFNENGEIIVGSPAKDMAIMYPPERVITAIKRQIGTDYTVSIDGYNLTPVDLSGAILKKMINDFNENHMVDVKKAVITCPAYFGQNERDATKSAGLVAGLESVTVINEPTAAAIAFGIGAAGEGKKRVMVYDLGGGTFDVTILEIDGVDFTAIATDGERLLGGKDWDAVITKMIKQKICEENDIDESELENDDDVRQSLILDSETIKKRLSTAESTKGTMTVGGRKVVYSITRDEFEMESSSLMQTTLEIIDRVLALKDLSMSDIDDVILVGGSSRMPQVKNRISEKYPDASVKIHDPDQSIAKGAAIFARSNNWAKTAESEEGIIPVLEEGEISVHNVLSKSFGIKVSYEGRDMISNIIFRNEVLPISALKTYQVMEDGQTSIKVEIYENSATNNEEGVRTEIVEGVCVGDFEMELPDGVSGDTPVYVKFTATNEGILIASAECLDKAAQYQLQNKLQLSAEQLKASQGLMEKVINAN